MTKKKVNQTSSFLQGEIPSLTKKEQRVLTLFELHGADAKKMSIVEKCNVTLIHRYLRSLVKKGFINRSSLKVHKGGRLSPVEVHKQWRCHAVRVSLLVPDNQKDIYKRYLRKKGNTQTVLGNRVFYWERVIEVRLQKGMSFFADNPSDAVESALPYVQRVFSVIESDSKVLLLKDRRPNMRITYFELSETKNEAAGYYRKEGEGLLIRAPEDGKAWLKIDNSFNLDELEFMRQGSQVQDADSVKRHLQDWRKNEEVPKSSDLALALDRLQDIQFQMAKQNIDTARAVTFITEFIKTSLPPKSEEFSDKRPDYYG